MCLVAMIQSDHSYTHAFFFFLNIYINIFGPQFFEPEKHTKVEVSCSKG